MATTQQVYHKKNAHSVPGVGAFFTNQSLDMTKKTITEKLQAEGLKISGYNGKKRRFYTPEQDKRVIADKVLSAFGRHSQVIVEPTKTQQHHDKRNNNANSRK